MVKNLAATVADTRDWGFIPGLGSSPAEGNGNPLQYSCQGNPMDRGAQRATVCGVTKSRTWPSTYQLGRWNPALNPVIGVLIRERQRVTWHMEAWGEKVTWRQKQPGVMEPRAKERLEPPETGRGKELSLLEGSEKCGHSGISDFWPPELWENRLCCFKLPSSW